MIGPTMADPSPDPVGDLTGDPVDGPADDGPDLAVVGMAGRFPGAASVGRFWEVLLGGREATSVLTPDELARLGVPENERAAREFVPVYGVLPGVDRFDAAFFGYSPRDAALLDPQQRLLLECAWTALERSGHLVPAPGELVGVYASAGFSTYLTHQLLGNPGLPPGVSDYDLVLANDKDALAARVAYHLDLRGPAVTVQTACSSSLVAVHLAGQALLGRECDVALAGGVHVRVPAAGHRYQTGGIMSRSGHCRPFGPDADGTVGGNGVGLLVLRRLADARRDGDPVLAVIRGSAVNNDGRVKIGFTAPSAAGQAAVIRMAHDAAGVRPADIGLVEAHGTATALGDQIELQALLDVFADDPERVGPCALGAVKSVVGHLDAAAGVTGLIKAVLAVRHGVVPPDPGAVGPEEQATGEQATGEQATAGTAAVGPGGPFRRPARPSPWPPLGTPRRAGVSSFGIGGTNAHVVVEEPPPPPGAAATARTAQLLVLSARSAPALTELRRQLARALAPSPDHDPDHDPDEAGPAGAALADIAYTLQTTRRPFPHRLTLVAHDHADAARLLVDDAPGTGAEGPAARRVRTGVVPSADRPVAFLFPGQGAQHVGMAAGLLRSETAFRAAFDECADLLAGLGVDLPAAVHPGTGDEAAHLRLQGTALAQPALFAVEYALARWWEQWGVRPATVLGHSVGGITAGCLAGVFSLPDALSAVVERGRLMARAAAGAMLSVPLPAAELEALLPPNVVLAADNAPRLSVAAGPEPAIAVLQRRLRERGVDGRRLHTAHAFHSPSMRPAVSPFAAHLRTLTLNPPRLPTVSDVSGDWLTPAQATDPGYWAAQLVAPVRFGPGLSRLLEQDLVLLEVGPGSTLTTFAQQAGAGRSAIATLAPPGRPRPDDDAAAEALGRLWLAGAEVDWRGGWRAERRRRVSLPSHPFRPERHWIDRPAGSPGPGPAGGPADEPANDGVDEGVNQPVGEPAGGPVDDPVDGVTETIRRIWAELLGIPEVGLDDDFFELGGHSLLGSQVIARIRDALGVDLPTSAVFEAPTVAALAEAVRRERAVTAPPADLPDDGRTAELLSEILALSPEELHRQLAEFQQSRPEEPR